MWNPFKKPEPLVDSTQQIFIGQRVYPLICDTQAFDAGVEKIRSVFRGWIASEITIARMVGQSYESHLMTNLRQLNVKMIAHDTLRMELDRLLRDSETNISGSRFMDAILYIFMTVPQEVIDTITGRFLGGVLYYLPSTVNDVSLPIKEDWLELLKVHAWIPLLPIYQEVFDADDVVKKLTDILNRERVNRTNVIRVQQANPA